MFARRLKFFTVKIYSGAQGARQVLARVVKIYSGELLGFWWESEQC